MFLSCSDSEGLLGFCSFLFFLANNFGILASWLCFLFDIFLFSTLSIQFKSYDIRDTINFYLEIRIRAICFSVKESLHFHNQNFDFDVYTSLLNSYWNLDLKLEFQILIRIPSLIFKFSLELWFEAWFQNSYLRSNSKLCLQILMVSATFSGVETLKYHLFHGIWFLDGIVSFLSSVGDSHCMKSVRIRSDSGPYFQASRLNNSEYGHFLRTIKLQILSTNLFSYLTLKNYKKL